MKAIKEARTKAKILSKKKDIKLKDALELVAKGAGKASWKAYKDSLDTFWGSVSSGFLNHWFTLYPEAKAFQKETGGYLLTFKGQYFVVQKDYIEDMGLDSRAEVWTRIDFDVSSSRAQELIIEYLDNAYK